MILRTSKCTQEFRAAWRDKGESFREHRYMRIRELLLDQTKAMTFKVQTTKSSIKRRLCGLTDMRHDMKHNGAQWHGFVTLAQSDATAAATQADSAN
jgi:hypothetical protein